MFHQQMHIRIRAPPSERPETTRNHPKPAPRVRTTSDHPAAPATWDRTVLAPFLADPAKHALPRESPSMLDSDAACGWVLGGAAADSRTSTRRQMSMMRQKLQRDTRVALSARPPTGTREGRGRRKMRSVPAQVAFALRASRVLRSARPSIENRAFELLLRAGFPNRPRQAPSPALLRVRVWKRDSVARAGRAYLLTYPRAERGLR